MVTLNSSRLVNVLFGAACLVVIILGGLQIRDRIQGRRNSQPDVRKPVELVQGVTIDASKSTIRSVGSPRTAIVEFSDFQCPYCGQYARSTYGKISSEFVDTGLVSYVFFNFPLDSIHPKAMRASEAAECAGRHDKFWAMHDALFRNQSDFDDEGLTRNASDLRVPLADFKACLAGQMMARIRLQADIGSEAGVVSTPTFFVGKIDGVGVVHATHQIRGAQPYSTFAATLREALAAK